MKKFLISIALLLLLNACESGYSSSNTYGTTYSSSSSSQVSDQSFINSKLSGRALSPIEGIWYYDPGGRKIGIYKSGDSFVAKVLYSRQIPIGAKNFDVEATSDSDYYGSYYLYDPQGNRYEGYTELSVYGNSASIKIIDSEGYKRSYSGDRIVRTWPTNLSSHNSKFRVAQENRIFANVNDRAQDECTKLGFVDGSDDLANCKLKLTTMYKKEALEEQKIKIAQEQTKAARLQEFAAKKQAAAQKRIAYQEHQKNSNALKQQGMKMLTGQCTLGIDC
jgi:hypothetical protein